MPARRKCLCGCGQAPSSTCRLRKAECRGCGYVIRLTREWIARGLPVCPCGEQMECRCLEDRMIAGDVSALSGMVDTACMPGSRGRRTGTHDRKMSRPLKAVVGYTINEA